LFEQLGLAIVILLRQLKLGIDFFRRCGRLIETGERLSENFKTGALNHSATLPSLLFQCFSAFSCWKKREQTGELALAPDYLKIELQQLPYRRSCEKDERRSAA